MPLAFTQEDFLVLNRGLRGSCFHFFQFGSSTSELLLSKEVVNPKPD